MSQSTTSEAANPSRGTLDLAKDPEKPPGGSCEFTLDSNIYRKQSCDCKEGFHEPEPPIVDGSAPATISIACEPDETMMDAVASAHSGRVAVPPGSRLDLIRRAQMQWLLDQRSGEDADGTPVFAGWLIEANGWATYRRRGLAYELAENHARVSCYPPRLPLVDDSAPDLIRVGCRRVRRRPAGASRPCLGPRLAKAEAPRPPASLA